MAERAKQEGESCTCQSIKSSLLMPFVHKSVCLSLQGVLKAVVFFAGAVIISRNFGEIFAV